MNRGHKSVQSGLFQESDFFRPHDRGQPKYEMLRGRWHEGHFITYVRKEFGYSRGPFYQALGAFRKDGLAALVDRPKAKIKPDKIPPRNYWLRHLSKGRVWPCFLVNLALSLNFELFNRFLHIYQ
jgi:hypothetical protein